MLDRANPLRGDLIVRVAREADRVAMQSVDASSFSPEEQYEAEFYTHIWSGTRFRAFVGIVPARTIVASALLDLATDAIR